MFRALRSDLQRLFRNRFVEFALGVMQAEGVCVLKCVRVVLTVPAALP